MSTVDVDVSDLTWQRRIAPPAGTIHAPARAAIPDTLERPFEDLRRDAPELGTSGVHPRAIVGLIGLYSLLVCSFWAFFGDHETGLTLAVITVLAAMFFGLLGGGILLSDNVPKGERGRGFDDFVAGRVLTATGWIDGKEALAQILTLPLCLFTGSLAFGAIWCFASH